MKITKEQIEAIRSGKSVVVNDSGTAVVLVRADVFDDLKMLHCDIEPWTPEEMDLLAGEDADRLGWDGMDVYQDNS